MRVFNTESEQLVWAAWRMTPTSHRLRFLMRRGLEDVWQPPGAAISVAAVVPGYAFYSCAGGKVSHSTWMGAMLSIRSLS